jgi:DNA-binding MarR family transcriptional regulator
MSDRRPIGFWLKLVDRLIDEQFALTLEEHGITRRQWQLLNVLAAGPASVAQLDAEVAPFLQAATDDSPAESSVEHLTELIESAWVDATPTGYELTERGAAVLARLEVVVAEQRTRSTEGVSEQEYLTTVSVLERVARNLGFSE